MRRRGQKSGYAVFWITITIFRVDLRRRAGFAANGTAASADFTIFAEL